MVKIENLKVGYHVAAKVGMFVNDIETPALIVDLDAFEWNLAKMREAVVQNGVALRAHAKAHKSIDVAKKQISLGGASGFCCQKVSEAEALVNAGLDNILISNQIVSPSKIERLIQLSNKASLRVCVDDLRNVDDLSKAAQEANTVLGCLVEINVGADRCGIEPGEKAAQLSMKIENSVGLRFDGIQAYHGPAQHFVEYSERKSAYSNVLNCVLETKKELEKLGLTCNMVSGSGTGTFQMEAASGVFTELQAGTYCFMDAAYMTLKSNENQQAAIFKNALFVLTTIMSAARKGMVVCDAGHKCVAVDSGLPRVVGFDRAEYTGCNDEHGMIKDPDGNLDLKDRIRLIPGHCDPTCNLHDYIIAIRGDVVEEIWPITARGKLL
ncbi:DSD1 family PLP-dependent enzyme [Amphritea sp. 2_MG-2023]|uniref:DSD1 family PLP-dependent enzyme n=1 Tax=Amphritea TaxID=515417 RepID=UPI001C07E1CB|nr:MULTISPECIES: DSD1 family PLP-dependent enzyme [Amphritea]MBU2967318.1 DSD1 family PLP-dependent enzyme [Amphritea atlantica]MDO6420466.1 DSD1 family PLP-dependent enzyme [Amphritea sp. 2_MG-2023]